MRKANTVKYTYTYMSYTNKRAWPGLGYRLVISDILGGGAREPQIQNLFERHVSMVVSLPIMHKSPNSISSHENMELKQNKKHKEGNWKIGSVVKSTGFLLKDSGAIFAIHDCSQLTVTQSPRDSIPSTTTGLNKYCMHVVHRHTYRQKKLSQHVCCMPLNVYIHKDYNFKKHMMWDSYAVNITG